MAEEQKNVSPPEVTPAGEVPKLNSAEFAALVVEHHKIHDPKARANHFKANPALARIFDPVNYK